MKSTKKAGKKATAGTRPGKIGTQASGDAPRTRRRERDRWRELVETSSAWIWETDAAIRHTYTNAFVTRCLGYQPAEFLGMDALDLIHPDDRPLVNELVRNAATRKEGWSGQVMRWRHRDGSWKHIESSGSVLSDKQGNFAGLFGIDRDITEQKRAADDLRRSEEKYRDLFENAIDAICIVDRNQNYLDVNRRAVELFGYSREEFLSMNVRDMLPPEQLVRSEQEFSKLIESGAYEKFTGKVRTKDGRYIDVEVSSSAIVEQGQVTGSRDIIRDITERRKADALLRESESRMRSIIESNPVGMHMYRLEPDGRLIFTGANPAADRILGVDNSMYIGRTIEEAFPPLKETEVPQRYREAARSGKAWQTESIEYQDNAIKGAFEVHVFQTAPNSMVAAFEDITARIRAAEALRKSERMLQTIIDTEPDCIKIMDEESRLIMMNRAGLSMLQVDSLDQVKGQAVCSLVAPEYRDAFTDLSRRVFGGGSGSLEFQMTGMGGRRLWLETHAVPLRNETDRIVAMLGVTRDITERKRVESRISKYSEDLQRLLTVSREMTATTDVVRLYRAAVRTAADLLGFAFSSVMVLSRDGAGLTIMDSLGFPQSMIGQYSLVEGQGLSTYVVKMKRPDAVVDFLTEKRFEVPAIVHKLNIRSALCVPMILGENVFGVLIGHTLERREFSREEIAIYENIGNEAAIAVKNAMTLNELARSEAKLRSITSSLAEGLYVLDAAGRITFMNEEAERLLGWSVEELNERGAHQLIHFRKADGTPLPLDACPLHGIIAKKARFASNDEVFVRKDGAVFPISVVCSPIIEDGAAVASVVAFRDITDTKRLEQEVLKMQKLESVGTLAGGIAHDFNNLLQGVFGYISLAKLTLDQKERAAAMLEQAEKALHQSVNLTSQLLTFSKGGMPARKRMFLGPAIENAVRFALSGSRVTYRIDLAQDLRPVEADEGQLGQVVHNIVLNAEQSMPLGGRIEVAAHNVPAASSGLPQGLAAADHVRISVRDSGAGIPAEYLPRIFDPYFTTKEKGSGLGLATSYAIVRNHGGMITVSSEPGKGSTFSVFLPAATHGPEAPLPGKTPLQTRRGRVLVMDDEEVVRKVAEVLLRELGHDVEVAEHGDGAIEKYRTAQAEGRPFDVVILDLTIRGGKGGADTVRELLAIDPGVKAVVSSGYSDHAETADYQALGFRAFLKKPYNIKELAGMLDDVMA